MIKTFIAKSKESLFSLDFMIGNVSVSERGVLFLFRLILSPVFFSFSFLILLSPSICTLSKHFSGWKDEEAKETDFARLLFLWEISKCVEKKTLSSYLMKPAIFEQCCRQSVVTSLRPLLSRAFWRMTYWKGWWWRKRQKMTGRTVSKTICGGDFWGVALNIPLVCATGAESAQNVIWKIM